MNFEYAVFYFFIFVLGLAIGSFLNCIIYRLEKEKSLWGRSYCPNCSHTLKWQDLIPVFSFLYLGGKCRYCSKKISWQYPIVELSTAVIFILIFNSQYPISSLQDLFKLCFMFYVSCSMIVIFVYDLKHYIIPDKILFPAIIITLIYQVSTNYQLLVFNSLWAGFGASLFFLLIFLLSQSKWIGFGDVKLAILLGLILGFPGILIGLFLAFLFGAIIGLALMIFGKKGLKSEVPFAPFLITGTFVAMFFGQELIHWYFSFIL